MIRGLRNGRSYSLSDSPRNSQPLQESRGGAPKQAPMLTVFDMDGVLFRMEEPLPGAAEAVRRLRARGGIVRFLTNNSSKSRREYVEKLARFDIPAAPDEIMTSAYATALLFQEEGAIGRSVYVVGENGVREELAAVGMRIVEYGEETLID